MSVLASRGLYRSIMKEQQQQSAVTKKLLTTVDVKPVSVNRPWQCTERGSDTGQPRAGQGSDAMQVRKQLVSEMDTLEQQKEVCIGHSKHLRPSPSVLHQFLATPDTPSGDTNPSPGGGRLLCPPRDEARAQRCSSSAAGSGSSAGSWGSFSSSLPECAEAHSGTEAQRHSGTVTQQHNGMPTRQPAPLRAQLCTLSKSGLSLNQPIPAQDQP